VAILHWEMLEPYVSVDQTEAEGHPEYRCLENYRREELQRKFELQTLKSGKAETLKSRPKAEITGCFWSFSGGPQAPGNVPLGVLENYPS
jgi:hypothetical protein